MPALAIEATIFLFVSSSSSAWQKALFCFSVIKSSPLYTSFSSKHAASSFMHRNLCFYVCLSSHGRTYIPSMYVSAYDTWALKLSRPKSANAIVNWSWEEEEEEKPAKRYPQTRWLARWQWIPIWAHLRDMAYSCLVLPAWPGCLLYCIDRPVYGML